jgi:hypothetical protein
MTDSEIEQWVLRELKFAEQIHSRELCVSAHQGIVTLGGTVPNRLTKVAAKRAALRAHGVKGVVNNLRARTSQPLRQPETAEAISRAARVLPQLQTPLNTDPVAPVY